MPAVSASPAGAVELLVDNTDVNLSGPGEWLVEKHGTQRRCAWKKLHVPPGGRCLKARARYRGRIVAATLTAHDADDGSQVSALLGQIEEPLPLSSPTGRTTSDQGLD